MLIIRNKRSGQVHNLYLVSPDSDLDRHLLEPTKPNNFLTVGKFMDAKSKIRLYNSPEDAISAYALDKPLEGQDLYLYRALGLPPDNLIGPASITTVPYAMILDEYWCFVPIRVMKEYKIHLLKPKSFEVYHYGPRSTVAKLNRWSWKKCMGK